LTIRDVQADFSFTTASSSFPIFGAAGTYLFPNTYDTSPLGAYLTEFSANDTQLSGNVNTFRDLGGGERIWLVVDWTQAVNTLTSVRTELITSASSSMSAPVTMIDFGVVAVASFVAGYRQIMALPRSNAWLQYIGVQCITAGSTGTTGAAVAWLGKDVDSVVQGYASGFSIK
jgi:hypothetical protein